MSDNKLSPRRDLGRLLDIACLVCGDRSSGRHYGVFSCDGCSGFFKRTIHKKREYVCKDSGNMRGKCPMDKSRRNQCRACRLDKCLKVNMDANAVQHERGPRRKTDPFNRDAINSVHERTFDSNNSSETQSECPVTFQLNKTTTGPTICTFRGPTPSTGRNRERYNMATTSKLTEYSNWSEKCHTRQWVYRQPMFETFCDADQDLLFENSHQLLYQLDKLFWENMIWYCRNHDLCTLSPCDQSQNATCKHLCTKFRYQVMDAVELSCLKLLVLYNPDVHGLDCGRYVEAVRNGIHVQLLNHIRTFYPGDITRYGRLLMSIPSLARGDKCLT